MISLSRRITIGTVVLTVAVVGLATAAAWMAARWQALHTLDGGVHEHAGRLAGMMERPAPPPRPRSGQDEGGGHPDHAPPEMRAGTGWVFAAVVAGDGGERFRTPSLTGPLEPLFAQLPADGAVGWIRWSERRLRAQAVAGRDCRGLVAIDGSATLAELDRLALTLGAVWVLASLLALLASWWLRRAVIAPLHALGRGIVAIDPERPGGRVAVDGPAEVAAATALLNDLLARVEALVEREKGAIANMAHELRTPISGLRTTLEVALLGSDAGEVRLARRCLPTVAAMHGLVANLLALARLEAGREQVQRRPTALAAVVAASWAVVEPLAQERQVELDRSGVAGSADTCPERLGMVLGNLFANAVEHAPAGSLVTLTSTAAGGRVRLRLANRFTGPAPDPQRVFEPFWRGDNVRSSPDHCGLGLPLARRLALLLGGTLAVTVAGEVFAAELELPAA